LGGREKNLLFCKDLGQGDEDANETTFAGESASPSTGNAGADQNMKRWGVEPWLLSKGLRVPQIGAERETPDRKVSKAI